MKKPLLLGGAAAVALGYFLFFRGKKKAVAAPAPRPGPGPIIGGLRTGGFHLPPLTTSGGLSNKGEAILADPSQLEGLGNYFSMGAFTGPAVGPTGRKHLHKIPCCSNCAQGLRCSG